MALCITGCGRGGTNIALEVFTNHPSFTPTQTIEDKDFFKWTPEDYDIIVSNPPFSKKREVFERLKDLNKPFIMIAPSMMLGYKYFQTNFKDKIYPHKWQKSRHKKSGTKKSRKGVPSSSF